MSVSPVPALPATAPHSGSTTISTTTTTSTATKSPPALVSIVKSATPPSLPQLPPSVAASPPALRRTSPTQSRDEDQSMSDSKPALASPPPPPTFSHTALPTSTASAIAGSPGSSASPKPLHSNSTSSPLLNHAAQLTAAQAPSQLALLLSSALADADALRRELTVAQGRATRAERLLASVQGLPSRASPDPNVDGEKTNGEREREKDVKAESKVPESAVKAVLDAEARAERAERAHADLAASLQSLCAQFTEVERYEHACSLRSADARAAFARLLSTASHAPVAYPGYPTAASSESPHFQHEQRDDALSLPSLPLPHAIGAPSSGSSMLTGPGAHPAPPASSTSLRYSRALPPPHAGGTTSALYPAPGHGHGQGSGHLRQSSQQSASFHTLPLPPPPSATGLSMSAAGVVPAKRSHRSRSGRGPEDLLNGECEKDFDEKRRRVGGWDMEVDSPSLSPPQHVRAHAASPPYSHIHASHPLSAHPTALPAAPLPHTSSRTYDPHPTAWSAHAAPPPPPGGGPTHVPSIYFRDREAVGAGSVVVPAPPGTNGIKYDSRFDAKYDNNAHAHSVSRHPSVTRMGYDDGGREHIRVDARELVRDAKERERRGREYASSRQHHHAPGVDYYPNAALQGPNVGAVARAHRSSRSRANGAGVPGARRRSVSRSSAGSSWSIDEMLLETATDREGGRRRDDGVRLSPILGAGPLREPPTVHQYQTTIFAPPVTGAPPGKASSQTSSTHSANGDARVNGLSPNANGNGNAIVNVNGNGINGAGMGSVPGGGGAKASVPSSQLVTLGPGGVVVSGGGATAPQAAALPGGGFPAQNAQGQRICRQCGVPGRYKDGKCVEKWGPGPEGPGTVCDRCRKKMKRVERRGTLDSVSASQQAQMIAHRSSHPALAHSQSQSALGHSAGQSQHAAVGRARATARQDTLLVDHHTGRAQTQSQMLSPRPVSHYREHERDPESRAGSSRSHSGSPVSAYASAVASGRLHPAESSHLSQGQAYPSAGTNITASGLASQNAHRRPPTPPYINSISTREQYANGSSSRALPHQHSQSHARSAAAVTGGGGTGSRGSSVNEEDLLDGDGDGDVEEEDALLDGEGEGEGDMDIDAEIARAANGSSSSLSSLTKAQNQSPLKTMPLSYPALSARQYHDVHAPGINSLANVAVSARGDSGKRMPMPLPSVATMDHAHAVSREYHASRGRGRASQMDELEDGFDGDADGDLPERGLGGAGDVDADGEGDDNGAEGSGEGSGEGDADADAEIMDAVDAAMKVED